MCAAWFRVPIIFLPIHTLAGGAPVAPTPGCHQRQTALTSSDAVPSTCHAVGDADVGCCHSGDLDTAAAACPHDEPMSGTTCSKRRRLFGLFETAVRQDGTKRSRLRPAPDDGTHGVSGARGSEGARFDATATRSAAGCGGVGPAGHGAARGAVLSDVSNAAAPHELSTALLHTPAEPMSGVCMAGGTHGQLHAGFLPSVPSTGPQPLRTLFPDAADAAALGSGAPPLQREVSLSLTSLSEPSGGGEPPSNFALPPYRLLHSSECAMLPVAHNAACHGAHAAGHGGDAALAMQDTATACAGAAHPRRKLNLDQAVLSPMVVQASTCDR